MIPGIVAPQIDPGLAGAGWIPAAGYTDGVAGGAIAGSAITTVGWFDGNPQIFVGYTVAPGPPVVNGPATFDLIIEVREVTHSVLDATPPGAAAGSVMYVTRQYPLKKVCNQRVDANSPLGRGEY
jgi:hypothetical protein